MVPQTATRRHRSIKVDPAAVTVRSSHGGVRSVAYVAHLGEWHPPSGTRQHRRIAVKDTPRTCHCSGLVHLRGVGNYFPSRIW
jgi:hypothetical protein